MKGIIKMDAKGNPSIVLPGLELKMVGPIADKFQGLPQKIADEIDLDAFLYHAAAIAPELTMRLELKASVKDYAQKEKEPEAPTPSPEGNGLAKSESKDSVNPDDANVKEA